MTPQRIAEELDRLRQRLVEPSVRTLHVHEKPDERVWLATARGEVGVYFDESRSEFGLGGLGADGSIRDRASMGISSARSWLDERLPNDHRT